MAMEIYIKELAAFINLLNGGKQNFLTQAKHAKRKSRFKNPLEIFISGGYIKGSMYVPPLPANFKDLQNRIVEVVNSVI